MVHISFHNAQTWTNHLSIVRSQIKLCAFLSQTAQTKFYEFWAKLGQSISFIYSVAVLRLKTHNDFHINRISKGFGFGHVPTNFSVFALLKGRAHFNQIYERVKTPTKLKETWKAPNYPTKCNDSEKRLDLQIPGSSFSPGHLPHSFANAPRSLSTEIIEKFLQFNKFTRQDLVPPSLWWTRCVAAVADSNRAPQKGQSTQGTNWTCCQTTTSKSWFM